MANTDRESMHNSMQGYSHDDKEIMQDLYRECSTDNEAVVFSMQSSIQNNVKSLSYHDNHVLVHNKNKDVGTPDNSGLSIVNLIIRADAVPTFDCTSNQPDVLTVKEEPVDTGYVSERIEDNPPVVSTIWSESGHNFLPYSSVETLHTDPNLYVKEETDSFDQEHLGYVHCVFGTISNSVSKNVEHAGKSSKKHNDSANKKETVRKQPQNNNGKVKTIANKQIDKATSRKMGVCSKSTKSKKILGKVKIVAKSKNTVEKRPKQNISKTVKLSLSQKQKLCKLKDKAKLKKQNATKLTIKRKGEGKKQKVVLAKEKGKTTKEKQKTKLSNKLSQKKKVASQKRKVLVSKLKEKAKQQKKSPSKSKTLVSKLKERTKQQSKSPSKAKSKQLPVAYPFAKAIGSQNKDILSIEGDESHNESSSPLPQTVIKQEMDEMCTGKVDGNEVKIKTEVEDDGYEGIKTTTDDKDKSETNHTRIEKKRKKANIKSVNKRNKKADAVTENRRKQSKPKKLRRYINVASLSNLEPFHKLYPGLLNKLPWSVVVEKEDKRELKKTAPQIIEEDATAAIEPSPILNEASLDLGIEENDVYMCDLCGYTCKTIGVLEKHKRKFHELDIVMCCVCEGCFPTKEELNDHMQKSHMVGELYRCDDCSKLFKMEASLRMHIRFHKSKTTFDCKVCGKALYSKKYLDLHVMRHEGVKPHECSICSKKFTQLHSLKRHIQIHSEERNFKCDECEQSFALRETLKQHKRTHSEDRPFACLLCDKKFKQRAALSKHRVVHSDLLPFKCDECGKCFRYKYVLQRHLVSHTGEKKFKCPDCDKCFALLSTLKQHQDTHSGKRNFECNICGSSFVRKEVLQTHVNRVHLKM